MTLNKLTMIAATLTVAIAANAATITDVTARQRWPWNNLVDVDFFIEGESGEAYAIDLTATAAGGEKTLCATTFVTEPIATAGVTNRVVWNLGADYPNFKATDFKVTVTATPFSGTTPVYLVVDLSEGSGAEKWPVRYTTTPPAHVRGATNEVCQTTELWLRRIPAGTDVLGEGTTGTTSGYVHLPQHTVVLTQPFYCAIFETTEKQYERMNGSYWSSGNYSSEYSDDQFRNARPVRQISHNFIRGLSWPNNITASGVIQKLRSKTGLDGFDIPTEAQWEYACRAGTDGQCYDTLSKIARYLDNRDSGQEGGLTAVAGTYLPNAWGLYDMIGNVSECCRDRGLSAISQYVPQYGGTYTNPIGPTSSQQANSTFVVRGGSHKNSSTYLPAPYRMNKANALSNYDDIGFRVVMVVGGVRNDNSSSEAPAE